MEREIKSFQFLDKGGCPEGGQTFGYGFSIAWQRGPLGSGVDRKEQNGAFVEDVIMASIDRLEFYQNSKFNCEENKQAIFHLQTALTSLRSRTKRRVEAGTEGTLKDDNNG